ncbi:hypothetical protein GGF31_002355 [Allomyces arbusculus]|nr:hypothetical protein GGF31_002355 [Allomyces arbusculus]
MADVATMPPLQPMPDVAPAKTLRQRRARHVRRVSTGSMAVPLPALTIFAPASDSSDDSDAWSPNDSTAASSDASSLADSATPVAPLVLPLIMVKTPSNTCDSRSSSDVVSTAEGDGGDVAVAGLPPAGATKRRSLRRRAHRAPSNFCFCKKCVPPTPLDMQSYASRNSALLENIYTPEWCNDINPRPAADPSDQTLRAKLLYAAVYVGMFGLRWSTVGAALVVLAAAAMWWSSLPMWIPTWLLAFSAIEVFLALVLMVPHYRALDHYFSNKSAPAFTRAERWRNLTESMHVFHPFTVPLLDSPFATSPHAATASLGVTREQIESHVTFLKSSRPLPSKAGQPFHIVPHVGTWLSGWFFGANPCEVKHDNLKEWFAWAFFNRHLNEMSPEEEKEVDEMADYLEEQTGLYLERGYDPKIKCIRLNLDAKRVKWRSAIFYSITTLLNMSLLLGFRLMGYTNIASSDGSLIMHLPKTLAARKSDPTRATPPPILFIHGLGVGIMPYLPFLIYTAWTTGRPIAFLNVPCVSLRVFPGPPPTPAGMNAFVQKIWDEYNVPKTTVVGHSLGTSFTSWLVKDATTLDKVVDAAVFFDPVCFGLCMFDVAYNFIYKTPQTYAQLFIRYFAGRDGNIANCLYRDFWWFENIIYRSHWSPLLAPRMPRASLDGETAANSAVPSDDDDMTRPHEPRHARTLSTTSLLDSPETMARHGSSAPRIAVFLSEYDSIVNSESVRRYLRREKMPDVTVIPGAEHGGFLFDFKWWPKLRDAIERVTPTRRDTSDVSTAPAAPPLYADDA